MLDTFKARLKAKLKDFKAQNLSQKRIDAIADRLHKKFPDLTDEADHDQKLDELNELTPFEDIAKQDDRIRTLENKPTKPAKKDDASADDDAEPTQQQQDDTPAWAKALIDSNKTLTERLQTLEQEKATQSLQAKVASHEKLKGIPQSFLKKAGLPESEDALDTFADSVVADWDVVKKEAGIVTSTKPIMGNGSDVNKVDPEVQEFINKNKRQPEKT